MRIAVLALALVFSACGSKHDRSDIDTAKLEKLLATRTAEVLARPDVASALGDFRDGVIAAPDVEKAADGVATLLGQDENLVATGARMLQKLRQLPALQALVRDVTVAHPDATPEQISELVAERLASVVHVPKIRASIDEAIAKLTTSLAHTFAVGLARDPHWTDALLDRALTADRLARFAIAVLGNRTARMATAKLLAAELGVSEVQKEVHKAISDLSSDPSLQDEAVALFDLMLSSQPDPVAIDAKLRKLLLSPRVFGIANHAIQGAIAAPGSAKLADDALALMAADPMIRRAYEDLAKAE